MLLLTCSIHITTRAVARSSTEISLPLSPTIPSEKRHQSNEIPFRPNLDLIIRFQNAIHAQQEI